MRSSLLSAVALAITSLFTVVRAADPPPWNVLYTNDTNGAYYFLDSSQGKIVVSSASNVDAVKANKDKGMRFRWGGNNTGVTCQADSKSFLGFDSSKQEFRADYGKPPPEKGVFIYFDKTPGRAYLCNQGVNCIGPNAAPTKDFYLWFYQTVPEA